MNSTSSSANGSQGTARWSLRLLGGFDLVSLPGRERLALPGKRERLLLAYLALSPNGRVSRRKLISLLWEDAAEEAALHSLRNCLSVLRKALGDAKHRTVSSQGEDIVLDLSSFDVDVLTFRRLAAQSGRAELEAAADLCSGDLLDRLGIESEEFESWRRTASTCHQDQSVDVLTRLMAQYEEATETERAIETGRRILGFEPLHEAAARGLMRLYGRTGRRAAAIGVYRSLAATLRGEVGAEPEGETRALFAELSRGTEDGVSSLLSAGRELEPPRQAAVRPEKAPGRLQSTHALSSMASPSKRRGYQLVGIVGAVFAGTVLVMSLGVQLLAPSHDTGATQATPEAVNVGTSVSRDAVAIGVGGGHGKQPVNNRSIDPDSYEKFLRGKSLFEARGNVSAAFQDQNLMEAATLLEGVVAKNPTYAPAWAFLGAIYFGLAANSATTADIADARAVANEFRIKGEAAAQKSAQLDSNLAVAYNDLAVFAWSRAKPLEAEELHKKALALDPVEPSVLGAYAIRLSSAGRFKEGGGLAERALRADPFYPNVARETVQDRWLNGQNESAIALAKTLRLSDRATWLALIYSSMRRFGEAADALMELADGDAHSYAAEAGSLLRMAPAQLPSATVASINVECASAWRRRSASSTGATHDVRAEEDWALTSSMRLKCRIELD